MRGGVPETAQSGVRRAVSGQSPAFAVATAEFEGHPVGSRQTVQRVRRTGEDECDVA